MYGKQPPVLDRTKDTSVDGVLNKLSDETRVQVLKEFIIELIQGGYGKKQYKEYGVSGGGSSQDAILMDNPSQS